MGGFRRVAPLFAGTNMRGDALSGVENFDDRSRQSDFNFAPRELVRNAVVMTVNFDVIVDANPRPLPFGERGQRRQVMGAAPDGRGRGTASGDSRAVF